MFLNSHSGLTVGPVSTNVVPLSVDTPSLSTHFERHVGSSLFYLSQCASPPYMFNALFFLQLCSLLMKNTITIRVVYLCFVFFFVFVLCIVLETYGCNASIAVVYIAPAEYV